jgi:hypothetical protein
MNYHILFHVDLRRARNHGLQSLSITAEPNAAYYQTVRLRAASNLAASAA